MKKAFLSLVSIVALIGFSSCSKNYTCSCTSSSTSKTFDVTLEKMRHNDAKVVCEDYSKYVGNCALK